MANFDPRIGRFQAIEKDFSYGQTQQLQEANCPQHLKEGRKAFEISDFLVLDEEFNNSYKNEDAGDLDYKFTTVKSGPGIQREYPGSFTNNLPYSQGIHLEHNSTVTFQLPETVSTKQREEERAVKYAFRTRSDTDILEDGYKWCKYGKKFVKNNPNPRGYYRCRDRNCDVKKTVERDAQDKGIVITIYLGKHNHEIPTVNCYNIAKLEIVHASAAAPNCQFGNIAFSRSL